MKSGPTLKSSSRGCWCDDRAPPRLIKLKKRSPRDSRGLFARATDGSRRERELELDVPAVVSRGQARTANRFPAARKRRPELRCPTVFQRRPGLERVALAPIFSAALTDHFGAYPQRVSRRAERNRSTSAGPNVLGAKIVVREQLGVQRTPAGSIVISSEAGRNTVLSTTFGARCSGILVVNPRVP